MSGAEVLIPVASAMAGSAVSGALSKSSAGNTPFTTMPSTGSSTTYSQLTPTPAAMPLYGWEAGTVGNMMQQPVPYFPGQTYVSPSDLTKQGVEGQKGLLNTATGNYGFLSNAADVATNPYVGGMADVLARRGDQLWRESILPGLRDKAIGVNGLGNDRFGVAQGAAAGNLTQNMLDAIQNLYGQAYGQGLGAQGQALGLTGNLVANMLQPGQAVEGYQQSALQDQINRYNWAFQEPQTRLSTVQSATQNLAPLGVQQGMGTTAGLSSSLNPYYSSPYQSAAGGALTGYGLGQDLTSAMAGKAPAQQAANYFGSPNNLMNQMANPITSQVNSYFTQPWT